MKSNGGSLSTVSDRVVEFVLTREIKDLENLTVSAIARKLNINRCYLSQRFKYDKKFSLHDYILMVKILRSLSLLEAKDEITIEVLSKKMGFASPDYFTRVFIQTQPSVTDVINHHVSDNSGRRRESPPGLPRFKM